MNTETIGISDFLLREIRHTAFVNGPDKFIAFLQQQLPADSFDQYQQISETHEKINKCVCHILTQKSESDFFADIIKFRNILPEITTECFNKIATFVASAFGLSLSNLLYDISRSENRRIARAVLAEFLHDARKLDERKIGMLLNCAEKTVYSKYFYVIPNLNLKIPREKELYEKCQTIKNDLLKIV